MAIQPIRTEADHDAAIHRIEALWGRLSPALPSMMKSKVLSVLVSAYEDHPMADSAT